MNFKIGAHVSISGGFRNTPQRIRSLGGNCGQIFAHSPRSWKISEPSEEDVQLFKEQYTKDLKPIVVHASYLINLATNNKELLKKSVETIKKEAEIMNRLGLNCLIVHSGSSKETNREQTLMQNIEKIIDYLKELKVELLLENSSGAGNLLNNDLEEWSATVNHFKKGVGACLDTCHAHAAGYDLSNDGVEEFVKQLKQHGLLKKIKVIHLNDSQGLAGSKKDRHQHLGEGTIGEEGVKKIINNSALREKPFILETPVTPSKGFEENIKTAKKLRKT